MMQVDTVLRPHDRAGRTQPVHDVVRVSLPAPDVRNAEGAPPDRWPSEAHTHDRRCWWDVFACRWAGPAHPDPRV